MPGFKNRQGLSLVEVLVAVAILSVVVLFLTQTFINYGRLFRTENVKVDLSLANQTALDDMTESIKNAAAVIASSTAVGANFTTNGKTLILSLPAFNGQKKILTGVYDQVFYYLSTSTARRLVKTVSPAAASRRVRQTKTLNSDVGYLDFIYNTMEPMNAKDIIITLATSRAILGVTHAVTSTQRAVLRNK